MEQDKLNFLNYLLKEKNFSPDTIQSYHLDLNDFFVFITKNNYNYLSLEREIIRHYFIYLDKKNLKNSTISRKISCLRSFYQYLMSIKKIDNNIFRSIKNPKIEKNLPNYLNYTELESILNSIDTSTKEGVEKRLLLEVMYSTGVRVSEVANIKIDDIDFANKTIRIFGKGSKERIVYFGEYVEYYLKKYLQNSNKSTKYLFSNPDNSPYKVEQIEKIVKDIMKSSGLINHVTPHTFRHTFATHLLNNGADIKSVQELLGHANLSTTGIYTHVSTDRLKDVYFKNFDR